MCSILKSCFCMQSDQRKKLEEENKAMLQERLESLKLEVEQEKADVKVR